MSDSIIKSLGAGSGIDTTGLVSSLVEIERASKEKTLDSKQEKLEAQISAYGTLKSSLSELQSAMSSLADNDTFNARSVSFPDSDVITPNSVDPGAQTGTYQIEVEQVAQAQSLATGSYTDKEAALNESGTLTISFGKWTYDGSNNPSSFSSNADKSALNISVETDDSLQDIADKINAEDSDVQASVLNVDGQYQLLLTAPSGDDNALRVTSDDATKGDTTGLSVFEFNESEYSQVSETQQAKDALLKVNGLTVSRETNEISDVIEGFSFSVNKADPGTSLTFTVSEDTSGAEQAIRDFVEAYNLFYETSQNLTGYKEDENNQTVRGDLATDGIAKTLINRVRSMMTASVPGVTSDFAALTNVGIRTELDGKLEIDEDDFKSAISSNFQLVESLFATKTSASSDQVVVGSGTYVAEAAAGSYDVVVTTNPEKATVTGNAQTLDFSSPPITLGSDYAFKITVDGIKSNDIILSGSYSTVDEIQADLQSLINGDENLKGVNAKIDVGYSGGAFTFTSRSYGSSSQIKIEAADFTNATKAAELGLAELSDNGVDVAGTIGGKTAFGAGNVLLPEIGSDPYGLNFTIGENAVAAGTITATFSRGLAGELGVLIDSFLSSSGTIQTREDSINDSLEGISEDREELDRKLEKMELRLYSQFLAMERIVSSFQSTGSQLDGILDRLPFTAKTS